MIRLFSILSAISLAFAPVGEVIHSEGGTTEQQTHILSLERIQPQPYFANREIREQLPVVMNLEEIPQQPDGPVKLDQAPPSEDEIYYTEAQIDRYQQSVQEEQARRQAEEEERVRQEEETQRKQQELESAAKGAETTIQKLLELGLDENAEYLGKYKLTAYCPCYLCCGKYPDDPDYGLTASGEVAQEGVTIAMDGFPFGTKVYIENVGVRIVQDRGGAIKGNRIDIFCSTHERCYENPNYVQNAARVWVLPDDEAEDADTIKIDKNKK